MAIQPPTAHLRGNDSQAFTSDTPVTWNISPKIGHLTPSIGDQPASGQSCVYTAPPKYKIWSSRHIVLSAVDASGHSVGSAAVMLDSAPTWVLVLTALYLTLFFALIIGVVTIWPPTPAVPFIDITPPSVTIAPGLTQQFDTSVWHARDQSVTWSVTDGLITPTGLFTATEVPASGRAVITATSNADKNLTRSALVLIGSPGLAVQPDLATLGPSETKSFRAVQAANAGAPPGGTPPAATANTLVWRASESDVTVKPNMDGTNVEVQAPAQFDTGKPVILTVLDKANPARQASAIVYLSNAPESLAPDLSHEDLVRDKGLLILCILMGGLGALLGASRSLGNFVGNDSFVPTWTLFYIFRPTFGAGLALLVFFGYRIGAITGVKGAAAADSFTAAFVAGMVGLFADTVLQKLKDVVTALFPTQDDRKDKVVETAPVAPVIELVESTAASQKMTVKGKNFVTGAQVTINGSDRPTTFVSPVELTVVLDAADTGDVKVVVTNPDKHASPEFPTKIGP
jgi:IPT/TIG domain/Bacterial Ig-like domain (group 2)